MTLLIVFLPLSVIAASVVQDKNSKESKSRKGFICDGDSGDKITCKRFGTLVKMWECGEGDYKATEKTVEHAAESACELYLKLKPGLDLRLQLLDEIRQEASQREALKEKLKEQYIQELSK